MIMENQQTNKISAGTIVLIVITTLALVSVFCYLRFYRLKRKYCSDQ